MVLRKAFSVLAVVLVLAVSPRELTAGEGSVGEFGPPDIAATENGDDGGLTIGIIGIFASLLIGAAAYGGEKVALGPVEISIIETHLHVGDEREVQVAFPFSLGNINPWDDGGYIDVSFAAENRKIFRKLREFGGPVQDTFRKGASIEAIDIGDPEFNVQVTVFGEDAGLFTDSYTSKTANQDRGIGILHPLGSLTLAPPGGENFDHGIGVNHILTVENHSSRPVILLGSRVNSVVDSWEWAAAGQDYGPPTSSQPVFGNVNHNGDHGQQIEPVGFQWGVTKFLMPLTTGELWKESRPLENGVDFCVLEGENPSDEPAGTSGFPPLETRVSSGCFTPGFLQRSEVSHGLSLDGITVTIINHPSVGPPYDLSSDATGQFCWSNLNLAEFVDITFNSDGNVPEIRQYTYDGIPLEALENGDPGLVMNYVEPTVPPIDGVLDVSDGGLLQALVYSRRSGYPDHLIGIISNGAFTLEGYYMLEFDSYNSELVFVPRTPFNRTLSPATPVVVPFDPTFAVGSIDIGTLTFNIAPRETTPMITVRGTFLDQDLVPIPGLEIEFHHGAVLVASVTTNASGFFEISVPNGPATVSSLNLEALGLDPLPPEVVDFGLNGMTVLDIGNRKLFFVLTLFEDGFESGDLSEWSSSVP